MAEQVISNAEMDAMKTLVHNELGFSALCKYFQAIHQIEHEKFITYAEAAVYNPQMRDNALMASGRVKSLDALHKVFKKLLEEGSL